MAGVAVLAAGMGALVTSPRLAHADPDLDSTCSDVLSSAPAQSQQGSTGTQAQGDGTQPQKQKLQYCQAAKSAREGADTDRALYKVWGAIGTVCTYACTASFAGGPTNEYVCTTATIGGGATQSVLTRDFSNSLTSIAAAGGGQALNHLAGSSPSAPQAGDKATAAQQPKKKDIGACLNAANAISTSFGKYKSMTSNEASSEQNLKSAAAVAANAGSNDAGGFKPAERAAGGGTLATEGATAGGIAQGSSDAGTASPCSNPGSGGAVLQCAVLSDRTLPSFVTSPKFADEFQKKSGQSLSSFLTGNDSSPTRAIGDTLGGAVPASQASKLATALETLNQGLGPETVSGSYAEGSAPAQPGSGDDAMAASLGTLTQGLQDMIAGQRGAKHAETPNGVMAVDFAYRTRSPASGANISDDKHLSLFDRVTYRYYFVGRRIVSAQQANPSQALPGVSR
jgi:hypothetical protein